MMRSLVPLIFIALTSSCIDFSVDPSEMNEAFAEATYKPESNTITLDTNHLHYVYVDNDHSGLVVFVHGSPGSWSAFMDYFKNDSMLQSFDMVSVDRPGYGLSDRGRPMSSMEAQAALISEVIRQFEHERVMLVGHSLGGPVIARIAMDYPELVDGLVMVAPSIDPDQEKYEWYRSWIDTKVGGWFTPTDFWVSNEEILPLKDELQLMLPLWNQIRVPTIVVQGTKDMLVPKENAEFARRMISDSLIEVRYLEGANHFIPWSHPEAINSAIVDIFAR